LPTVTTVEETWRGATEAMLDAARSELGSGKPERRKVGRQPWLWTNEVKEKVRETKRLYHAFLSDKTAEKWRLYQEAKKSAKRAVAVARATYYDDDVNERLGTHNGEQFAVISHR
uniref:DHC_N1 domain-containing protein n=1 Tax=Heligmosomoides polygyrus TaxID=6339 RepID=A0A183GUU7_HELPZ